jgi:hypothetical protein
LRLLPPFSAKAKAQRCCTKNKREEKMPTYAVEFNTDAETAFRHIKAKTAEGALKAARRIAETRSDDLNFHSYSDIHPIEEIVVKKEGGKVCRWQSDDLRLRLAAPDLLAAACAVIDAWATGDFAAAVRELAMAVVEAKPQS